MNKWKTAHTLSLSLSLSTLPRNVKGQNEQNAEVYAARARLPQR